MKDYFPRLAIKVLLDGLYANGPVIELCKKTTGNYDAKGSLNFFMLQLCIKVKRIDKMGIF
ncbi:hypothetical protein DSOL_4904 [Desulfosporosinus metallidurans]|uniref:Uncharacterized protein n=1 Tax=Desulfosporosinus metallidurans TaxID=1888891 RepID=A0A1Q8QH73_9FIRM|nr:hypothetical protein DSOL_4904 [Desulfosporosinus metallidurans]